jgi:hypothetical protein
MRRGRGRISEADLQDMEMRADGLRAVVESRPYPKPVPCSHGLRSQIEDVIHDVSRLAGHLRKIAEVTRL